MKEETAQRIARALERIAEQIEQNAQNIENEKLLRSVKRKMPLEAWAKETGIDLRTLAKYARQLDLEPHDLSDLWSEDVEWHFDEDHIVEIKQAMAVARRKRVQNLKPKKKMKKVR